MTQSLHDFVTAVRSALTIEDEKFQIATELAQIRAFVRKMDPDDRPLIVSKLVFLDMIGENVSWGQMEAIALMTSERYSYKRIGYICTSVLLDQTTELTVLVTQTLLHDLKSNNSDIQSLALSFIANLGNAEVCRAVATEVQKLLDSKDFNLLKKAGMATVKIISTNPDLVDSYKNSVQYLLNSLNHGAMIAGINMVTIMLEVNPKLAKSWSQFSIPFTKILKRLINNRPLREYSYNGYNDPYMQVKTLKALSLLKRSSSEELDGILQIIVSNTEAKNTGRSILYQSVETIVTICKNISIRGLAFNQIGRLLSFKDPNVLYSSLSVLARVLYKEKEILANRGSIDSMALQRYKSQIVALLNHQDPSIRRRALDVISALINEKNAESLIPEILTYVKLSDSEFRSELVAKIYVAVQRFGPNNLWRFDTVEKLIIESGNYVSFDILSSFCELIAKTPDLQRHAAEQLSKSIIENSDNQILIQISAFVIGELAVIENGAFESLKNILIMPQTTPETKLCIITALSKLAVRFNKTAEAHEIMTEMVTSNNLEIQQRAGEMMKLLEMSISREILAPVASSQDIVDNSRSSIELNSANSIMEENEAGDDLLSLMLDSKIHQSKPSDGLLDGYNNEIINTNMNTNMNHQDQLLDISFNNQNIQNPNQKNFVKEFHQQTNLHDQNDIDLLNINENSSLINYNHNNNNYNHNNYNKNKTNNDTNDEILEITPHTESNAVLLSTVNQTQPQNSQINNNFHNLESELNAEAESIADVNAPPQSIEITRNPKYILYGQTAKNPNNPKQIALRLLFYNLTQTPLNNFTIEMQVSPGWLLMNKAEPETLQPRGTEPLTIIMYLLNEKSAPFSMRIKISYMLGTQSISELVNMPPMPNMI
ncbi:Adaptin N terminal region family protein [Tritrichomonas foetus]|uniref:AP-1 complex subunit gamma n=1 Tax=Tritrichomonas foetus TaxID=1144522 RepID=A0A1J4KK90_9EUKA|nr:Adaptin N terminal region family protein [Tritrichomonas foetus]|eukprot:OHT10094.1 Adaptin N terminal region family protein [Tritrichomonas foetus]